MSFLYYIFVTSITNEVIKKTYSRGSGSIGILIKFILKTEKTSYSNGGPRLLTLFLRVETPVRQVTSSRWITKGCGCSNLILLGVSSHLLPAYLKSSSTKVEEFFFFVFLREKPCPRETRISMFFLGFQRGFYSL